MDSSGDAPAFNIHIFERMMAGTYGHSADSREAVLDRTAKALMAAGVERVRYYQIATETAPELAPFEESLYLTWLSYEDDPEEGLERGLRIPLADAAIYQTYNDEYPDPVTSAEFDGHHFNWYREVGLAGRSWVDVLVSDRARKIGLLALDWHGHSRHLNTAERTALRLIGQVLGSQLGATSPVIERRLQDEIQTIYSQATGTQSELTRALSQFQQKCDIASISLFRYEWTTQRLIREWISAGPNSDSFPNESFELGEKLTGIAFSNQQYHRILDYTLLQKSAPQLLSADSVQFHNRAIGEIRTVMYGVLGISEPMYLIRAINHRKRPELPFVDELELLTRFAQDLSPYIDAEIASERSASVSHLQQMGSGSSLFDHLLGQAQEHLKRIEGISRIAVVMGREAAHDGRPHLLWGVPAERQSELRMSFSREPAWLEIHRRRITDLLVLRRQDSGAFRRSAQITSREQADTAILPVRSGSIVGAIIFPVYGQAWSRRRNNDLIRPGSLAYLQQVGALIAQWTEQEYVSGQTKGAQQALSLVGHELSEPLAATKEIAERALDLHAKFDSSSSSEREDLRHRLRRHVDALSAGIQLGYLVGRQIDKRIVGKRSAVPVLSLTNFAISRANHEMDLGTLQVATGTVRITRPTGGHGLYLVCDKSLAEVAILNILRNAIKYSVRTTGPAEIFTHIRRRESGSMSHTEISISNNGTEIPPVARELIFDPFTRFTENHRDIDRRGMGLGLYLSRQIAMAHMGDVTVAQEIIPGIRQEDGTTLWRTTFTLRLRDGLSIGSYVSEDHQ